MGNGKALKAGSKDHYYTEEVAPDPHGNRAARRAWKKEKKLDDTPRLHR